MEAREGRPDVEASDPLKDAVEAAGGPRRSGKAYTNYVLPDGGHYGLHERSGWVSVEVDGHVVERSTQRKMEATSLAAWLLWQLRTRVEAVREAMKKTSREEDVMTLHRLLVKWCQRPQTWKITRSAIVLAVDSFDCLPTIRKQIKTILNRECFKSTWGLKKGVSINKQMMNKWRRRRR